MAHTKKLALVTGASSGFGIDFSDILAKQGIDLILVARSEDKLRDEKIKLETRYGITAHVIPMDLSVQSAGEDLFKIIKAKELNVDIVINNAGFGVFGRFADAKWEDLQSMFNVDMITLASLTWQFANEMRKRGGGYILNVASVSGYHPVPLYAGYAAAKAFVLNMSEALNVEFNQYNIKICALAPGFSRTGFLDVTGMKENHYYKTNLMDSYPVAEQGIKALFDGKPAHIPGLKNRFMAFLPRLLPRKVVSMASMDAMSRGQEV